MDCRGCGASNLDGAARCSSCGEPLEPDVSPEADRDSGGSRGTWVVAGVVAAAAILFAGLMISSSLGPGGGGAGGGAATTPDIGFSSAPEVARLGSDTAIATAIELSREGWSGGAMAAVLYSVEDSSAAAVAGPLATTMDAPILLGSTGALDATVVSRLTEMGVSTVTVLDSGSFTSGYDAALGAAGIGVKRVVGAGPVALSDAVARDMHAVQPINGFLLVARGGEQRAVLAGAYAGANGLPVLIVDTGGVTDYSGLFELAPPRSVVICAPDTVVPDSAFAGSSFSLALLDRVDAPDDYTFAQLFSEYTYAHGFEYDTVFAVQASHVRHAFAVAPLAARDGASTILVGAAELGDPATTFFVSHASAISTVRFVGPADPSVDALLAEARRASETLISADAYPLDQQTSALVTAVTSETVTFEASPAMEATLTAGKIIVSGIAPNVPEGFLRRIISVSDEGGTLVVQTEQASLSEVIVKGSFDIRVSAETTVTQPVAAYPAPLGEVLQAVYTTPTTPEGLNDAPELQQVKAGSVKSETDHIKVPVDWPALKVESKSFDLPDIGGEGKFSATVDASESWETWYVISASWQSEFFGVPLVQEFGIVAYLRHTYELDYEVVFEVSSSTVTEGRAALPKAVAQKIGGTDEGKEIQFTSTFSIGPVPVVLVSYVSPYFGFEGSVKGTVEGHYEKTIEAWVGAKVRFDTGKVTPVVGVTDRSPKMQPPTASGEVKTKVSVGLKIGTRLYGVAGPYMRGELFFKGDFNAPPPPGTHPMLLQLGLEGTVGGDLKVVFKGITLVDGKSIEFDPIEKVFWKWPEGPPPAAPTPPPIAPAPAPAPTPPVPGGSTTATGVATVIVIDVSGSMEESSGDKSKLGAAQDAAHVLIDLLEGYLGSMGNVSVVTFADYADVVVPPTEDEDEVRSAIDGLSTWGMTNIYAGLRDAVDELRGVQADDRAIFFLSDGLDTVGNDPDDIVSVAAEAGDDDIDIITIGFGDASSLDEDLLQRIAGATPHGEYSRVDASVAVGLIGRFATAQMARSGAAILYEKMGSVSEGETVPAGATAVPATYGDLEVVLAWPGSDMDVILTDPAGVRVAEGYPGFSVTKTERTAQVKVAGAKSGDWQFEVNGIETSTDDEPFYLVAAHRESTATPPAAGGGGAANSDGSGLLVIAMALLGIGGIAWVVLSARPKQDAPTADGAGSGATSPPTSTPTTGAPTPAAAAAPAATPGPGRPAAFVLVDENGTRYPLAMGATTLGRSADNDIVLADPSVSRNHAVIVTGDMGLRVKDLGSTRGTAIDGTAIEGSGKAHVGSTITVGAVRLTVAAW